jgi:hypothetical protein
MPMKKYRHQKRNLLFAIDVHSVISPHFDKKILVRLNLYVQNPRPIIILISDPQNYHHTPSKTSSLLQVCTASHTVDISLDCFAPFDFNNVIMGASGVSEPNFIIALSNGVLLLNEAFTSAPESMSNSTMSS